MNSRLSPPLPPFPEQTGYSFMSIPAGSFSALTSLQYLSLVRDALPPICPL